MDTGVVVTLGGAVVAVTLYIIRSEMRGDVTRLDGRINAHEEGCEQRQIKLDERHQAIEKKLDRIDDKLDRLVR